MKKIEGYITRVDTLSDTTKKEMITLFSKYFFADREQFKRDLQEKESVIILKVADSEKIVGFSTCMFLETVVEKKNVKAIFSGDTVVERGYWNEKVLMKNFENLIFNHIKKGKLFYWFLISMGYRTYRFLPLFFKKFFPRYDEDTPLFEQKVMDKLALLKFGKYYDKKRGIIIPATKTYLRQEYAKIPRGRLKDPHIKFFQKKNPGHKSGEELVCIAEISHENLKPSAHKVLKC